MFTKDDAAKVSPEQIQNAINNAGMLFFEATLMRSVLQQIFQIVNDASGRISIEQAATIAAMSKAASEADTVKATAHAQEACGLSMKATVERVVAKAASMH